MKSSNIIRFPGQPSIANPCFTGSTFDYEAYERRAVARFRRASICAYICTAVEALVTAAIGLCIILFASVYFTML